VHPSPSGCEELLCLYSVSRDACYIFNLTFGKVIHEKRGKPFCFIKFDDNILLSTVIFKYDNLTNQLIAQGSLPEDTYLSGCYNPDKEVLIFGHTEYQKVSVFAIKAKSGTLERQFKLPIGVQSGRQVTKSVIKLQMA